MGLWVAYNDYKTDSDAEDEEDEEYADGDIEDDLGAESMKR
jgi:hypothetical protein